MTSRPEIEYFSLGHGLDGKLILRQNGVGRLQRFHLRFVTVDATTATNAKKIQSAWRASQDTEEQRSDV